MKIFKKYAIVMIAVSISLSGIFGCKKDKDDDMVPLFALLAISADASSKAAASAAAAKNPVVLGTTAGFAILSKAGITNTGASVIRGDIGSSPIAGTSMDNITCAHHVSGIRYTVDALSTSGCFTENATKLTTAVSDMEVAYTAAAGRTPTVIALGAGNIGGLTLVPGIYKWSTGVTIPTNVTLNGGADGVWVFQIAQQLVVSNAVIVNLTGGALAQNVTWQVGQAVTLGTTSQFKGTILGQTAINVQTGATVDGRLLAQTQVTLQANTITKP